MLSVYRMIRPFTVLFTLLLVPLVLAGCSSAPELADAERFPDQDYTYVIGPGDTMEIFVWGNEELSTNGIVRPDGKFTTRLVEDLEASGKTSTISPQMQVFRFASSFKIAIRAGWASALASSASSCSSFPKASFLLVDMFGWL